MKEIIKLIGKPLSEGLIIFLLFGLIGLFICFIIYKIKSKISDFIK